MNTDLSLVSFTNIHFFPLCVWVGVCGCGWVVVYVGGCVCGCVGVFVHLVLVFVNFTYAYAWRSFNITILIISII